MSSVLSGVVGPRIGLWGRFDVASFGDLLIPRVFEGEMRRRLPRLDLQTYAPLGPRHPVALDGGMTARALGAWNRRRTAELAEETDCVVIGGGDVIHTHEAVFEADYELPADEIKRLRPSAFFIETLGPALERRCPVAWNAVGVPFAFRGEEADRVRSALGPRAYLSVRDAHSKQRLRDAGVEARVEVVPDPAVLAARAFPADLLLRRLDYLRFMDWYPTSVEPLVVQGSAYLVARARPIARALLRALRGRTIPIVLIETESGRGETEFLDALEPLLAGAVFRVPSSAAVSDIVAVLAHARAFVGTSVAASLAAAGFGVPALRLEAGSPRVKDAVQGAAGGAVTVLASGTDLTAPVRRLLASSRTESLPSEIEARLESHFDRIAEIADSAGRRRSQQATRGRSRSPERLFAALRDAEERIETLRAAHEARGEQMLQQRFRLAEALERREAELKEEAARAAEEIARTRVALESIEGEKTRLEEALSISSGAFALARAEFEASHFRELEAASAGRAQVEQTLATEVAGRERLLAELSALQRDSDRLARDLAGTVEERDALSAELAALRNTTELLGEQLRSAREGIRSSEEIRTQAEAELARANAATEVLAGELTRLRSSLRHASEQESNLVISRAQALAELKASRGELEAMFRELEAVRVDREAEVARLRADLQNLQSQLHEVTSLKVFRYSAPFRAVYRRLLRLVRGRDRTA